MVPENAAQARQRLTDALAGQYPDTRERGPVVRLLLAKALNLPSMELALHGSRVLLPQEQAWLQQALQRLQAHEPLQYVLGEAPFRELMLAVGPGCLIPRPETEELVQWLLDDWQTAPSPSVLDIGTGSGCIALAIKNSIPHAKVAGWEVSPEALHWAALNAQNLHLDVDFSLTDIRQQTILAGWDIVISNPPYVAPEEARFLESRVVNYEPHLALFAPAADPLYFYRIILDKLAPGSTAYFELHSTTALALRTHIKNMYPHWEAVWREDLQGRLRMLRVRTG
ncbi:MAG: peptide chain release factor N(5)-glutamine methyltransferase [Bacteroidetes bacterium]|nr:peptide chain release factor N(5)-glutamine methyltransferase [Bacteroidota bacterium]